MFINPFKSAKLGDYRIEKNKSGEYRITQYSLAYNYAWGKSDYYWKSQCESILTIEEARAKLKKLNKLKENIQRIEEQIIWEPINEETN